MHGQYGWAAFWAAGILTSLAAFNFGIAAGLTALSWGVYVTLASLAGLGIAYGFLAIVKAQTDSRNALVCNGPEYPDPDAPDVGGRREPSIW